MVKIKYGVRVGIVLNKSTKSASTSLLDIGDNSFSFEIDLEHKGHCGSCRR